MKPIANWAVADAESLGEEEQSAGRQTSAVRAARTMARSSWCAVWQRLSTRVRIAKMASRRRHMFPVCNVVAMRPFAESHPMTAPTDLSYSVPPVAPCRLGVAVSERLRSSREALTRHWLDRILARVTLHPNRVFPSEDLLNHVPLLIDSVADYLENPAAEIGADMPLIDKARELGALRYRQGFDVHQILKEHELLKGILLTFLARAVDEIDEPCDRGELIVCAQRVSRATEVILQSAMSHFLMLLDARVREREERLRSFNRMVSHELKTRVGAVKSARAMLREPWVEGEQRVRFERMVDENVEGVTRVLDDLQSLARIEYERGPAEGDDRRQHRNVRLPAAARDVVRQLREMARARGVQVRVATDIPEVEVSAAAIEICLMNYVSNAIKYADPRKPSRWVSVEAQLSPVTPHGEGGRTATELIVRVRDNGIGVPVDARSHLFERFFRAHDDVSAPGIEGTGLGLNIVRDTVDSLGGRAWAEFPDDGMVFAFALPYRRTMDRRSERAEPE
jgi:signal transduction histidine kinase